MEQNDDKRRQMVDFQLKLREIKDPRVLQAMQLVPREAFVSDSLRSKSYEDQPLPIGEGQTISQPYVVALMAEALELSPQDRVLEIGTGSGYAAAILGQLAAEVYTVERHSSLAMLATHTLKLLGYKNIHVKHGDGTLGWSEYAPYDAIAVAARGSEVPNPLLMQLKVGGRLVMPIGEGVDQTLVRIRRDTETEYSSEPLTEVRFVPLVPGL